ANGVIIITTKKGKQGKAKINAAVNYTASEAVNLRNMMSLAEFGAYRNAKAGSAGEQFFPVDGEMRYIFSGSTYDPNDPTSYHILSEKNWQDEIYHTGLSQN